jgi:hypothetical protein
MPCGASTSNQYVRERQKARRNAYWTRNGPTVGPMLAHAIDNAARTATSKGAHSALRHPDRPRLAITFRCVRLKSPIPHFTCTAGDNDYFRIADIHVSHLSSEGRGVPSTLARACKSTVAGCSTQYASRHRFLHSAEPDIHLLSRAPKSRNRRLSLCSLPAPKDWLTLSYSTSYAAVVASRPSISIRWRSISVDS